MASEAKKVEAAAKEAKRVAENERMIALCAERRRAKEAAAAASSKSDDKSQPRTNSDDARFEQGKSDPSDPKKTGVPNSEVQSVVLTQRTQASTRSEVKDTPRRRTITTSVHSGYEVKPSANVTRTGTGAAYPVRKTPSATVVRRRVSRDARSIDGLGVKYREGDSSSLSSSSQSRKVSSRPHLQEPRGDA